MIKIIPYARITADSIKKVFETTVDHCSGHVYPLITMEGQLCVILGHNAKYGNVASFGGFSEQHENKSANKESLLETILREYAEESLGCITTKDEMREKLFNSCALITRRSPKGQHYTAFCNVDDLGFDYQKANDKFKQIRSDPNSNLTEGEKENDYIVCVPLDGIKKNDIKCDEAPHENVVTKDYTGQEVTIRGINMPAYRWLFSSDFYSKN